METQEIHPPSVEESEKAIREGKLVGSGTFRDVYRLGNSPWVYKREIPLTWANNNCNAQEMHNFMTLRDRLPEGVDFPEMVLLDNGTLAVRFVNGIHAYESHLAWHPCVCASHGVKGCWAELTRRLGIRDLHGKNVMISKPDGKVYIIDIGEDGE